MASTTASAGTTTASAAATAESTETPGTTGLPQLSSLDDSSSSSSSSILSSTTNAASSTTTAAATLPSISTTTNDFPTLSGGYSYPAPSVPPRTNAPYLASSNLPQDFVFIVVGAALAFIALLILGWRITTAYTTNRTVKRGAGSSIPYAHLDHKIDGYAGHGHAHAASVHDLKEYNVRPSSGTLGTEMKSMKSGHSVSQSNLFFSPTAAAANATRGASGGGVGMGPQQQQHRSSTYLSSGYYGAGQAAKPEQY